MDRVYRVPYMLQSDYWCYMADAGPYVILYESVSAPNPRYAAELVEARHPGYIALEKEIFKTT